MIIIWKILPNKFLKRHIHVTWIMLMTDNGETYIVDNFDQKIVTKMRWSTSRCHQHLAESHWSIFKPRIKKLLTDNSDRFLWAAVATFPPKWFLFCFLLSFWFLRLFSHFLNYRLLILTYLFDRKYFTIHNEYIFISNIKK